MATTEKLKLTRSTWRDLVLTAFATVADASLEVEDRPPWRCDQCDQSKAAFRPDGSAVCANCSGDSGTTTASVHHGHPVGFISGPGFPRLAIACVAGGHLISPMAGRAFRLGHGASTFVEELRRKALPVWGLTIDADGIWRRADRSRADGVDVADLVFGNQGGIWSADEIADFVG